MGGLSLVGISFGFTGEAAATCLAVDVVGKLLAVGNVVGGTIVYILETSEQLVELRWG